MMEADIIQTDVLKWTVHHRGGSRVKKNQNLLSGYVIRISNVRVMSPWLRFQAVVNLHWRDDAVSAWGRPVLLWQSEC